MSVLAAGYAVGVYFRNVFYDCGILSVRRLSVPVICVGNLTVGGTGKTPLVIWLCRYLSEQGYRPALLSRGYKAASGGDNDEVALIREALPDMPIVVDHDRVRGGREAIRDHQADVLVLDDGFQHRRLGRDFNIVAIDATCPFGYEALLPRGLLREPVGQLIRADAVVLTRSDQVGAERLADIARRAERLIQRGGGASAEKKPLALSCHRPTGLFSAGGDSVPLAELHGKRVAAFCGIGNPDSFVTTLEQLGAEVVGRCFFGDHHHYGRADGDRLGAMGRQENADWLVTTEKDWVKLKGISVPAELPGLHWLKVEAALTEGSEALHLAVQRCVSQCGSRG